MLFQIPDVLSVEELGHLQQALAQAEFVDGKTIAGWYARQVKHNQQLKQGADPELEAATHPSHHGSP